MTGRRTLDHRQLYRLPWSVTDNVVSWLEPTKECNIYCDGCYSANAKNSHKTIAQIRDDLDVFDRYRRTDAVSIAGGDPLTHPEIVEVVRLVSERGLKPVLNTNGHALTPQLVRELKRAGAWGFTFHVDSLQTRPGWTGKGELELNDLRLELAERVAEVGGLSCAFNATVYERTLPQVPELLEWGMRHADKVHLLVFIAFRQAMRREFDYFAGERKIDIGKLTYAKSAPQRIDISADEVVDAIRERFPAFAPAAYLNGTEQPDSFKWLLTLTVSDRDEMLGSAGPKLIELAQVFNHLVHGRYLGYVPPKMHAAARSLLALSPIDRGLRGVARAWLGRAAKNPVRLLKPLHLLPVMIIQPIDVLPDGRQSMCDSCPDMTVHDGQLVWSCRLDERLQYGRLLRVEPMDGANGNGEVRTGS